jgi:HEAT repeat protein
MLALQDIVQIVNAAELWQFVAAATPKTIPTVKTVPSISPEQARQQILAALPQLDATTNGRTTWIHRLRDLLRVDESLPGELLKAMQSQHFSDRTQADLYLAFELAGTESAQAALTSVIQNPDWSTRDAMRAIIALAGVKQPHVDTIEVLWETAETAPASPEREQLVSTATLALGSMGKTLRENSDANYDVLRDRLLTNATANGGPGVYAEKRTNYLYALSNTKDPTLTREVVYFLEDESPQVRRAAAMAVGSLDTDGVADHLLSRFSQEGNSEVRSAIVESLVNWSAPSKDSVATISAAIRNEADENTRLNMARFLGEHLQDFPDNGVILQELLRTEQSKRIRQNIADTLATAKHTANADGNSI